MGLISRVSSRTYRNIKMDAVQDLVNNYIEQLGKRYYMDYRGQELSESLSYAIIAIFTIIGIVAGYHYQMQISVFGCMAGIVVATLVTIPPWPCLYKKTPIVWLKPKSK